MDEIQSRGPSIPTDSNKTTPDAASLQVDPVVAIVGLGQIGCSIAGALAKSSRFTRTAVVGVDPNEAARDFAAKHCSVATTTSDFEQLGSATIVIVATPPDSVLGAIRQIAPHLRADAVITDCASVKCEIMGKLERELPEICDRFVGGHPMAGNEGSGYSSSNPDLFRGAAWVLTSAAATTERSMGAMESFVKGLGATPVRMTPAEHDRHVALLSHLPHLLAALAIAEAQTLVHPEIAGGSWKDLTRISASNPDLWVQILLANRAEIASRLRRLASLLSENADLLDKEDRAAIHRLLATGQAAKAAGSR